MRSYLPCWSLSPVIYALRLYRKAAMEEMYALLDLKSVMSVPVLHRCRCWGVVIEHNSGWKAVCV